ncbi:MAG: hypothetical protein WD768_03315 [Phycisphaeraceae bacterium]
MTIHREATRIFKFISTLAACLMVMVAALATPVLAQGEEPSGPAALTPILPIDQIKIGAKGYGLTVFHGDKIEAFPVVVISVMRDFAPKRGVIWIHCPDERLEKSGPVSGMSGSPIYLWDEGEKQEVGKGGKLIGAFAFGFGGTKGCFAGVQPIELMRQTGSHIKVGEKEEGVGAGAEKSAKPQAAAIGATLIDLLRSAKKESLSEDMTWKTETFARLTGVKIDRPARDDAHGANDAIVPDAWPAELEGKPMRLMLPMSVSNESTARALAPLFEPIGITPMQAPAGISAGMPPPGTDAKAIKFAPGSVLAIPLAFGDADLSATGTVTDVLPDGRVLGFGHPMFGMGDSAVPMATGYVHFIVPRLSGSFKLGGSAVIKGTILRDDASAVAGAPGIKFTTAPVNVKVNIGGKSYSYKYQVVNHERLTPSLAATVALQSLTAEQNLPTENTLRLTGTVVFSGDRKIQLNSVMSPAADQRLMFELVPPIATMVQNQHEPLQLKSLDLTLDVTPKIESINLIGARIDKSTVQPGEKIDIMVTLQPYGGKRYLKRVTLTVPDSVPEGRYLMAIGDGRTYNRMLFQTRPHLMTTTTVDDLYEAVKTITAIKQDALYVVMMLPQNGIAVGRNEMPRLPSSRRALIASSQNTVSTPLSDWVVETTTLSGAVVGEAQLEIEVKKDAKP